MKSTDAQYGSRPRHWSHQLDKSRVLRAGQRG
jgi:hypothetical protein